MCSLHLSRTSIACEDFPFCCCKCILNMNDCNIVRVPDKLLRQGVNEELQVASHNCDDRIFISLFSSLNKLFVSSETLLTGHL